MTRFLRVGKAFWSFIMVSFFITYWTWLSVPEVKEAYDFYVVGFAFIVGAVAYYTKFKTVKIPEKTFMPAFLTTTGGMLGAAFAGTWLFNYVLSDLAQMVRYVLQERFGFALSAATRVFGFQINVALIAGLYYAFTVAPVEECLFTAIGTEVSDYIVRQYVPKWTPWRKLVIKAATIITVAGAFMAYHLNAWVTLGGAPIAYLWVAFAASVVSQLTYRKWRNIMANIWGHAATDLAIVAIGGMVMG